MAAYREEEDPFEEDIVFDQAGLLNSTSKMNTAIRRVSSGKCVLFAKTLGLCGAFFGLGLCIAIPGPMFLSPLVDLENNVSPVSTIYVARTSGYVIGAILGGVLFDRFNRLFLLFLSLLLTAIFITITPWCQVLWILETCMIILGITMGFLDTGGNVLCLDLWGRNSGPFMQALHFSFGLGAFVAPLLAAPFLEPTLANSTLSTDFSHAITEFPVHLEDMKTTSFHEGKFRRDVESIKDFSNLGSDEIVKSITDNSLIAVITVNTSKLSTSPVSVSESSIFAYNVLSDNFVNFVSTKRTFTKHRLGRLMPPKTVGSKLYNSNWYNVHVGVLPTSDMLPPGMSSTPPQSLSPFNTMTETTPTPLPEILREDSKMIVHHEGKFRRDAESVQDFFDEGNDEKTKDVSGDSFPDFSGNISEIPTSSVTFSDSSTTPSDSLAESVSNSISTQSTSAKPRVPKRKPSKTDASKLGNQNWDRVHVGIPPASDLLPLSTSSTPQPSVSQVTTATEATTSVSIDTSTSLAMISSVLTSTDSSSSDLSSSSSVTTTEYAVPLDMIKKLLSPSPSGNMKITSSNNSVIPTSPPSVLDQSPKPLLSVHSSEDSVVDETSPFITHDSSLDDYSSLQSDGKMGELDSLKHILDETPSHSSVEKAIVYNSKDPLPGSLHYKNTTPDLNSKSQSMSGNVEENAMHSDKFIQKIGDKSVPIQKNEISTTLNSILVVTKVQQEDAVSSSPLDTASTFHASASIVSHSHHMRHKPGTFDNDTEHINTIFDIFANRIEKYGFNKIQFTYLIVGIFVFLISLVFLGFLCHNPRDPKSKQEGLGGKKITNKVVHKLLVPLMAFFFFLYMGLEVTYGQLVLVFTAHSNLQLSVVFWGSFAAMRFASIFFASGFSPLTMLMLNFAFCTSGTILVSALANHLETSLWVGTALIGIGLASMFPSGILWIERYIHVSNKVAAVFVIGVALGKLICLLTIFRLMVIDRMLFMYAALVINIVCILTFTLLWWLASHQGEKYSVINNNGYQLANQHDEEEDMMDMSPSGSGVMPRRHCFSSEHRSLLNGNIHRGP